VPDRVAIMPRLARERFVSVSIDDGIRFDARLRAAPQPLIPCTAAHFFSCEVSKTAKTKRVATNLPQRA
jgi:hypothetical protein